MASGIDKKIYSPIVLESEANLQSEGGQTKPAAAPLSPGGKNLLLLDRFSFMILRKFPCEEVIPVYRPLFFTPLKS
jgi:hypothetical protein